MKKSLLQFIFLYCSMATLSADTVVSIHGFLTDWRSMRPIKGALKCSDHEVIFWQYRSRQKFIEQHAQDLALYLQNIACRCPSQPIHFVTHSVGGLILRSALNVPCCPEEAKIGRAVLIAPPNQGSSLARKMRGVWPISFVMGKHSGWQLMHYQPCDYCSLGEFPSTMQVLTIAGTRGNHFSFNCPNDGYLTVEETRLNTPCAYRFFPFTHGDLLRKRGPLCCMRDFIVDVAPSPN